MSTLQGTEKQIKWATDIVNRNVSAMAFIIEEYNEGSRMRTSEEIEVFKARIQWIESRTRASELISFVQNGYEWAALGLEMPEDED